MKMPHKLSGKNLLLLIVLLLLVLSLPNALSLNTVKAHPVEYPAIYIEPEVTDETLPPGSNFTISVKTNYTEDDIWGWGFTLSYDSRVLHGGINKTDTWTGDDVTTVFNTAGTPVVENSEEVYVNQTLMTRITERTDIWVGDGMTRTFITTQPIFPGSETVLVGGYFPIPDWDYTIEYSTGNITFLLDAPAIGAEIEVEYDNWGNYTIDYSTGAIEFATPPSGVEVKATYLYDGVNNGDLITALKDVSATLIRGSFNNTIGNLSYTTAFFYFTPPSPAPLTSGPGTLANINFTVVGYGISNITLGEHTSLKGRTEGGEMYDIIDVETMPDHIQHGRLINVQSIQDVAVFSITAPDEAMLGEVVPIDVTVVNEGNYTESVTLTVYNGTTEIGTDSFPLARGLFKTSEFSWSTTDLSTGTYTINATATITLDEDPSDNNATKQIELTEFHDVAITNISAPTPAVLGDFIPINVTVANQGSFDENNVNVTIFRDSTLGDILINTTVIDVPIGESETVELSWNTTDLSIGTYTIKATATIIDSDAYPSDNIDTEEIELELGYDVAVMSILRPHKVVAGEIANITVVVKNNGVYDVTAFVMNVTYDAGVIETRSVGPLASGNETSLLFSWNTTDIDPASYTITAEAILAGDQDLTNNQKTKSISIIVHPIASFTFSPSEPIVAGTVTFNASASSDPDGTIDSYAWNFGDGTEKLYIGANLTAITTHNYTAVGKYTVNLTVTDKDDLNDTATIDVTVVLHDIAITNVTASTDTATIGEQISINVTVVNEGTVTETFNVTVYYDDTIIGTQFNIELASGEPKLLIFSWDTSNVTAGTYKIKAVATPVPGETDADKNDNIFITDDAVTIATTATLDALLYVAVAVVAAIIIAAVAIYFLKIRKPT